MINWKFEKISIFGINCYTDKLIENLQVFEVIDDFYNGQFYNGVRVKSRADANKKIPVINCAGGKILSTNLLLSLDFENFVHVAELIGEPGFPVEDLVFNEGFQASFELEAKRFNQLREALSDAESVNLFDKIIGFRRTYDVNMLSGITDRQVEQYFEEFLDLPGDAVFYDVGCYDGFTSSEFLKRSSADACVVYFEPNKKNFDAINAKFIEKNNVWGISFGLSDTVCEAYITDEGSESKVASAGQPIKLVPLDEIDNIPPPDLIKLDIEGGELSALKGMRKTIKEHKPALAIACYHYPLQFLEVFEEVVSNVKYANISFRHYTESIYESVLFFYD